MKDELQARRKARAEAGRHDKIADFLANLYDGFTGDRLPEGQPRGIVVVRLGAGDPIVNSVGIATLADYQAARLAIEDAMYALRTDCLRDPTRAERRRERQENERLAAEQHERDQPFKCSHERCTARFKTGQGRKIHERSCRYIKARKEPAQG